MCNACFSSADCPTNCSPRSQCSIEHVCRPVTCNVKGNCLLIIPMESNRPGIQVDAYLIVSSHHHGTSQPAPRLSTLCTFLCGRRRAIAVLCPFFLLLLLCHYTTMASFADAPAGDLAAGEKVIQKYTAAHVGPACPSRLTPQPRAALLVQIAAVLLDPLRLSADF